MIRRLGAALAGLGALLAAGCDNPTKVTRVDRFGGFSRSWIVTAAAGGMPVVVHGAPFAGVEPEAVVARLRFPGGKLPDTRFRLAGPADRGGQRLVLVFNRADAPDAFADCAREAPPPVPPNAGPGFTASAAFCGARGPEGYGHLEAWKTPADDPEAFAAAMTQLFLQILGQEGVFP